MPVGDVLRREGLDASDPDALNCPAEPGIEYLLQVIQKLSMARSLPAVQELVRQAARKLTGCDGATFVLRDGDACYYADEDAIAPLWKGRRFPIETCISGWSMLNRANAVVPDVYGDDRIPVDAYRPTFVKSLVMVPIRSREPIGAIGNYWATPHAPSDREVQLLQALADSTSIALENIQIYRELEDKVAERTQELRSALDQISHLSLTDDLTGLHNRRGFNLLAGQALRRSRRAREHCTLAFIDLDGLKKINDELGHGVGDSMIRSAATLLRQTFRESDVIARLGGDEFCVLAVGERTFEGDWQQRLEQAAAEFNAQSGLPALSCSIGVVRCPVDDTGSLDELLEHADRCMYENKNSKQRPPASPLRN